jgi:putative oxygen-independent coproporphyrinogen III oxidase
MQDRKEGGEVKSHGEIKVLIAAGLKSFVVTPVAAYIHIPFCRRRCYYCDFPISVLGDRARGEAAPAIGHYLTALIQEITITAAWAAQSASIAGQPLAPLETIYFGGGTPSLLDPTQVHQILECLRQGWGWQRDIEISLEVDPGTFNLDQLQGYRQAGVTRLSLGVQSFEPELLAAMGRTHRVPDIIQAAVDIQAAGFDNWSLDLISGLPNQTFGQWQYSVQAAIDLSPSHLSCYDLVIEPGTVFGKRYQPGERPLPTDDLAAQMYRYAQAQLSAVGYQHYEISNYSYPGYHCRHNQVYWRNQLYYGFGMGATSYVNHQRFSRPRTRQAYYDWLATLPANLEHLCEPSTRLDIWLESLMLGLRLGAGVDFATLSLFPDHWRQRLWACLKPHLQKGWVIIDAAESRLQLSDPEGFLFSNQVLVDIWSEFEPELEKQLKQA